MFHVKQPAFGEVNAEISIQGSRFIGTLFRLEKECELRERAKLAWKQHPKATHVCTAFRILSGGMEISGSNDDGEPHGTAGRPMLEALKGQGIVNVGILVVRYFGGTKLGKGGLARAYVDTVKAAVKTGVFEEIVSRETFRVACSYSALDRFRAGLVDIDYVLLDEEFGEGVKFTLKVATSDRERFEKLRAQFAPASLRVEGV